MLTTKWLQHMCKTWSIIFIEFNTKNWYLQPWSSSIHSTTTIHTKEEVTFNNVQFKEICHIAQTSEDKFNHNWQIYIIHNKIQKNQKPMVITNFVSNI